MKDGMRNSDSQSSKQYPLKGIRILAITPAAAGPFGLMILGDLGAEVILIENIHVWQSNTRGFKLRPSRDWCRTVTPMFGGYPNGDPGYRPWNRFPMFNCHARNKLSCTIDLTRPEGMDLFSRLISVSDGFVESNATGVMEKLGISYNMLKALKADIIYARLSGYGSTGTYKYYRGIGSMIDGAIGHTSLRTYQDDDPTNTTRVFAADSLGGATLAFAFLAALNNRRLTGEGKQIEISLVESCIPLVAGAIIDYVMNGRIQVGTGNRNQYSAPCGCYCCKSEGGKERWVNIEVSTEFQWDGFCKALDNPSWTKDEKFSSSLRRQKYQDDLDSHIEAWTKNLSSQEVMYKLQAEGVPAGPVMDCEQCFSDPHLKERRFFQDITQKDAGRHLYPGMLFKMSKTNLDVRKPPVRLGEDNEYVFKGILGMSDDEYKRLEKTGQIGMDYAL